MVQAADLLLLTDLKTLCCEFLEGCIAAENCIGIRDFALHYCLHHVQYLASEYLETHFRDVSSTEEFLELTPQKLKEVLAMEKLNVGNERYVFEAVIRWISHDSESRKVRTSKRLYIEWDPNQCVYSNLNLAFMELIEFCLRCRQWWCSRRVKVVLMIYNLLFLLFKSHSGKNVPFWHLMI